MKRSYLRTTGLILIALLSTTVTFSQMVSNELKAKIDKLNKEFAKATVDGNTEKILGMYTADAISLPSYSPMLEGIDAIRKASEMQMKSGSKTTAFDLKTTRIIPSGNLYTDIGTYKITIQMAGMDKPMDDHGKFLTILEKQKDGSFKVKVETWNSDVPPMMQMPMEQQTKK